MTESDEALCMCRTAVFVFVLCFLDKLNFKIPNGTYVKNMPSHLQYEMVANQIISLITSFEHNITACKYPGRSSGLGFLSLQTMYLFPLKFLQAINDNKFTFLKVKTIQNSGFTSILGFLTFSSYFGLFVVSSGKGKLYA